MHHAKEPDKKNSSSQMIFAPSGSWPLKKPFRCCVYNSESGHAYMNLVEIPVRGALERPISNHLWAFIWNFQWTPEGRGLIVSAQERGGGPLQVEYVSHKNGEVQRITNDPNFYMGVSLAADSNKLATVQRKGDVDVWVASLAEVDGAKPITSDGHS